MNQVICQLGLRKCIYVKQTNLAKLREYVLADFQDLPSDFDFMYVDQQAGDWMLIQTQKDLDRVFKLRKNSIMMKILPTIKQNSMDNHRAQKDVNKLIITQQMKNMIDFITQKHLQKYLSKKITEKILKQSDLMLEEKIPPSRTIFWPISTQIQQRLSQQNHRKKKIRRISPPRYDIEKTIEKSVNCKLNQIFPNLIQSSQKQFLRKANCRECLSKQLEMQDIIRVQLIKKVKRIRQNPEQ